MTFLDVRSVYFGGFLSTGLCVAVLAILWHQNRRRFAGLDWWMASFILQSAGLGLLNLHGSAPDWVPIFLGNGFGVVGLLLMLIGLEQFVGKPGSHRHNHLLLGLFILAQAFFTYGYPSVAARYVNLSVTGGLLCLQCAWLLYRRVGPDLLPVTRGIGHIFLLFVLLFCGRIAATLFFPSGPTLLSDHSPPNFVMILASQMLFIAMTFGLTLLINRRLYVELEEQSDQYRQMFAEHSAVKLLIEPDSGRIMEANLAAAKFYGYPRDVLQSMRIDEINVFPSEKVQALRRESKAAHSTFFLFSHRLASGEIRDVEEYFVPIRVRGRNLLYALIHDVTERKRAEEALRASEELFRLTLGNAPITMSAQDKELRFIWAFNHQTVDSKAIVGKTDRDLFPAVEADRLEAIKRKVLATGMECHEEMWFDRPDRKMCLEVFFGPQRDEHGTITGVLTTSVDITGVRRAEEQLRKIQKLDSLGVLAGGIAHDFNNLLAGLFGYLGLALEACPGGNVRQYLEKAVTAIDRARALSEQLLTFAKGGNPVLKVNPLFPFIEETVCFALSGTNVSCRYKIPGDLPACKFDRNQIGQVVDNMVINARQAMPNGGTITISAAKVTVSTPDTLHLAPGPYVRLSIADTGSGIPPEILPQIFDPFFSTKTQGHGLGLATAHSIVKRHSGSIDVESRPGNGTTFHVYLPAANGPTPEPELVSAELHRGQGLFLVMDDDVMICQTVAAILSSVGYKVVCKGRGEESLEFFTTARRDGQRLMAMIFDLTIPGGMGGRETITGIRRLDPDVPVFVMSGYADDPVMADPVAFGFTASLPKPFLRDELLKVLNRHLKRKRLIGCGSPLVF